MEINRNITGDGVHMEIEHQRPFKGPRGTQAQNEVWLQFEEILAKTSGTLSHRNRDDVASDSLGRRRRVVRDLKSQHSGIDSVDRLGFDNVRHFPRLEWTCRIDCEQLEKQVGVLATEQVAVHGVTPWVRLPRVLSQLMRNLAAKYF
jgi:hypothetical protein